jgi:hypothetical protein
VRIDSCGGVRSLKCRPSPPLPADWQTLIDGRAALWEARRKQHERSGRPCRAMEAEASRNEARAILRMLRKKAKGA